MVLFLILATVMTETTLLGPGDHRRTTTVNGQTRSYLLHVPASYQHDSPSPLVLAFHGGGSNPEHMVSFSGLNETADKHGFLVVYPAGTGRVDEFLTFNGGNCCGYAMRHAVDDVAFVETLLAELPRLVRVDPRRVYATGMSNGALMAYRLAAELSEKFAAIAPVGGPMGTETCRPEQPVSVIHFHGLDDAFAPYEGGRGKGVSKTHFFSVEHSIQAWITANGCRATPTVFRIRDRAGDGTSATVSTYGGGRDGTEVVLIAIAGMGHTWPGRESSLKVLGRSTRNVDANEVMWEFFKRHARP